MHRYGPSSEPVSAYPLGQLQVSAHDRHSLRMDRAQIGVLEQGDKVCLCCLLKGKHGLALESHLLFELCRYVPDQTLEGQFSDQQVCLRKGLFTLFWNFLI